MGWGESKDPPAPRPELTVLPGEVFQRGRHRTIDTLAEVVLGPDDVLLLQPPRELHDDDVHRISAAIPEVLKGRVIVIGHDWTVRVARFTPVGAAD